MTTVKKQLTVASLFFLFFSFLNTTVFAQTTLKGRVTNEQKEPLPSVIVSVDNKNAETDLAGNFSIILDKKEEYRLQAVLVGFKKIDEKIKLDVQNGVATLDLVMEENNEILNVTTVTAGKFEKPLSEVTVSLDIVRPSLIENVNTRKIDDVLQKVPGVNIIDGQPNIRGGSGWSYGAGSRVLVLVDDIPALQADAGFPNWRDFPVENVEQIEIVKGAASALYGSSAMNGIINIRTGYAKSKPETKISTFGVAYLTPKDERKKWWGSSEKDSVYQPPFPYEAGISALHKQKFGKFDLAASGFYINTALFNKENYDRYGRLTLNTRYRFTEKLSAGINANFNSGFNQTFFYWQDEKSGAFKPARGTVSSSNRQRYWIDPFVTFFDGAGNRHKFLGRYYNVRNNLNNNQANGSDLIYSEYQFQRTFLDKIVVTAGVVGTFINTVPSFVNDTVFNPVTQAIIRIDRKILTLFGDTIYKSRNVAGYLQADAKFDRLNISVGMRVEQNTISGPNQVILRGLLRPLDTITSPNGGKLTEARPIFRFGANYRVAKATFLRASWGQGYRFPTVAEMFVSTNVGGLPIVPNPLLTSETGWTAEFGAKQGFKLGGFKGFFDGALFWSEYQNMLEFQPRQRADGSVLDIAFQSQNIGNTVIKGFEVSLAGQGTIGELTPSVLIGYTYIDPKYQVLRVQDSLLSTSKENVLKYRFRHNFKFDGELAYKNFTLGASVIYTSFMEAVDVILAGGLLPEFLPGVKQYRADNQRGATVFDLRTSVMIQKKLKITLIGSNLLNTEYSNRPGLLESPRHAQVRLDYSF